ncbi:uncharacterized protein LOC132067887 [Lycium ferocissimum]|uniref:uncharacterized protein LOC132067887 n=1 Tax=Lycium ferocissimum TaxID=112874 RepID=UPI002815BFC6|nr:uncharacterized protein LOC132067887 [Lycium ferocissimum]
MLFFRGILSLWHSVSDSRVSLYDLLQILPEEFYSLMQFLYRSEDDLLGFLLDIEEEERSFRKYSERIRSNISNFLETVPSIGEEWGSIDMGYIDLMDRLEFLKREFKLLCIILNFRSSKDEPHVVKGARDLFQVAANDLFRI